MITESTMKAIGSSEGKVLEYLDKCDDVYDLPNGFAVRKGNIVHVLAPQIALSGRSLIRKCRGYLSQVHATFPAIYAPILRSNILAQRFAKIVGFKENGADMTHIWFVHRGV